MGLAPDGVVGASAGGAEDLRTAGAYVGGGGFGEIDGETTEFGHLFRWQIDGGGSD